MLEFDHRNGLAELVGTFSRPPIERKNYPEFADFALSAPDNLSAAANYAKRDLVKPSGAVNAATTTDRQLIGSNIRLGRKLAGKMRQDEFADRLNKRLGTNLNISAISRWEHGRRVPNLQTMGVIAEILGQSRGWFYDEHPELTEDL